MRVVITSQLVSCGCLLVGVVCARFAVARRMHLGANSPDCLHGDSGASFVCPVVVWTRSHYFCGAPHRSLDRRRAHLFRRCVPRRVSHRARHKKYTTSTRVKFRSFYVNCEILKKINRADFLQSVHLGRRHHCWRLFSRGRTLIKNRWD